MTNSSNDEDIDDGDDGVVIYQKRERYEGRVDEKRKRADGSPKGSQ